MRARLVVVEEVESRRTFGCRDALAETRIREPLRPHPRELESFYE